MSDFGLGVRSQCGLSCAEFMTDTQLLQLWARDRDEEAFAELVRRHQDMVYSTCLRKLGSPESAQDAAQQTFATLSLKAAKLAQHSNIGGWLYKSALLESSSLLKMETRRHNRHERFRAEAASDPVSTEENAAELNDLLRHLDEAMLDLKTTDREVLVRRFLQNMPLRNIGEAMGTTEEAARKRVTRAIDALAGIFRRRGVVSCTGALLSAALAKTSHSAPAGLLAKATASAKTGASAASFATAMAAAKAKLAVGCALAAASIPIGLQWRANRDLHLANEQLAGEVAALKLLGGAKAATPETSRRESPVAALASVDQDHTAPRDDKDKSRHRPGGRDFREQQRQAQQAARLALFKQRLGLSEAQESAILEAMQRGRESQKAIWASFRNNQRPDFAGMQRAQRTDLVTAEEIRTLLTDEQQPEYDKILAQDRLDRAQASANRQLEGLQPLLYLTEDQKDAVFQVLATNAYNSDPDYQPEASSFDELRERMKAAQMLQRDQLAAILTSEQLAAYVSQPWMGGRSDSPPPPPNGEPKEEPKQ